MSAAIEGCQTDSRGRRPASDRLTASHAAASVRSTIVAEFEQFAAVGMHSQTPLRQEYEAEVQALVGFRAELTMAGIEVEQIARKLHKRRRAIGLRYKLRTPLWGKRGQLAIYRRNLRRYGNVLGPSVGWLRRRGRTWEEICESACHTGGRDLS